MNPLSCPPQALVDVQSSHDQRNIAIQKVGVKSVRHPIVFSDSDGIAQPTIGDFSLYVHLPAHYKGTHMSRFLALLNEGEVDLSLSRFPALLQQMRDKLEASHGYIEVSFPYFRRKVAPVSGVSSLLDYQVKLSGEVDGHGVSLCIQVMVPVTSLCPCSKKISNYGAHNQRSHVTLTVRPHAGAQISLNQLIDIAEREASCELYGLLKRPDEKYVTERAYENPKFVEDLVRDLAASLQADPRIASYTVEAENFESIHNHSAYAQISSL